MRNNQDENNISIIKQNNSFEQERDLEHLKHDLSPNENKSQKNISGNIKSNSKNEDDKKSKENNFLKLAMENQSFENDNLQININNNNDKDKISRKFRNKTKELENFCENSIQNEIKIKKIDYSKSRSKSNDLSKEKEKENVPISQKYKKTNLKAAFGKLLNEKNLISELRKNFLKSLTKLNDNDTKEIAFSELKELINTYCTPESLRIYLNSLSTNYSTCTLAAKEIQAILIGYIAYVFQDNLLDCLDKPPNIFKAVARMSDILINYLKLNSNVIHKACSYSFQKLFKYSMPKDDHKAIILIFIDPLLPLVSSGANKMCQLGGAIVLSDLIAYFGKENNEILIKCHTRLIASFCKTKVENQFLVRALTELIRYLDIDYFMFYLKEIYERLINVLNNPKSNYCSRINSLECFKVIANKLKKIDDEILGYHLTEIIFTLQNACKDRVHKVQLAANSAIRDWREIEDIYERNKKKRKYDKNNNFAIKESNLFKIQNEGNFQGDKFEKGNYENESKNKKMVTKFKHEKMNKLNVLRKLSKLNKQDCENNLQAENKKLFDDDDIIKYKRNNRNINEFFKLDDLCFKNNNNIKKNNNNKYSDDVKEETYKKGIGNVLKLSNLLKNFQKENQDNILNDFRSKSNPRSMNKVSPPKNKLLESVANYLRISKSGDKNEMRKNTDEDYLYNKQREYDKGKITDINFYKKNFHKFNNDDNAIDFSQEELLDYHFLSDVELEKDNEDANNFIFDNEAIKNIENYEKNKNHYINEKFINKMIVNEQDKKESDNQMKIPDDKFNTNDKQVPNKRNNYVEKENPKINKDLILLKTDINNMFFNLIQNMERFNNNVNLKLNSLESKIKKNKRKLKTFLAERKLQKDTDHMLAKKNEKSQNKGNKNESYQKEEDNKNSEIEKNSLEKSEAKNKCESQSNKNEIQQELSKRINTKSSKQQSVKKEKEIDKELNLIEFSDQDANNLIQQEDLINVLKKELDFYKMNNNNQDIFQNINYKVESGNNNVNLNEASSIKFWREILELVENEDFNDAYIRVIESEDDLYLIRLLCITGPVLNCLRLDVCKKLIMRANLICRSHQIEQIMLNLINSSHQHYIFNLLTKNEQNELLETLFQITGLKSILGKYAFDLYEDITIKSNK